MKRISLLVLVVGFVACADREQPSAKAATGSSEPAAASPAEFVPFEELTLVKTKGRSAAAAYELRIFANGRVTYFGENNVAEFGEKAFEVDADVVEKIAKKAIETEFGTLDTSVWSRQDCPRSTATNHSGSVTLGIKYKDTARNKAIASKSVCKKNREAFFSLVKVVEEVVPTSYLEPRRNAHYLSKDLEKLVATFELKTLDGAERTEIEQHPLVQKFEHDAHGKIEVSIHVMTPRPGEKREFMNLGKGETSETLEIANLPAELKANGSTSFLTVRVNPFVSLTILARDIDKPKMIELAKSVGVQKLAELTALDIIEN